MSMLREIPRYGFQSFIQEPQEGTIPQAFSEEVAAKVHTFHQQLPGYAATRLAALKGLAKTWGVGGIFVKDEATRFDLKAFKVLGGSYAVARLVSKKLGLHLEETDYRYLVSNEARAKIGRMTFATATDGNHGRGIAWAAEQFGQEAMIYMPKGAAPSRVQNIRSHGAKVEVTELNYDDAVRLACRNAKEEGWHLIQDTAWEGYEEIPLWIMQGYMTMAKEAVEQMAEAKMRRLPMFLFRQGWEPWPEPLSAISSTSSAPARQNSSSWSPTTRRVFSPPSLPEIACRMPLSEISIPSWWALPAGNRTPLAGKY